MKGGGAAGDAGRKTHSPSARASPALFSVSKLVVGSSSASTPQFTQKVSASAKRMTSEASTFCPALQRPRMSISVPPWAAMRGE